MKPNPERVKEIFSLALQNKSLPERDNYLAKACQGEPQLRQQVETLLLAYEQAGDFLGKTVQLPASAFGAERAGTMIGRYKLLEPIGEGGFGSVWMAEQAEPVRRRVALKIIKPGMDTKQVLARFEAERQALAMMDHPSIARVFDGGATETGRPYFVMELVRGARITDYCDANKLSTRERLNLFIQVCQAVQHAHQKGIIHRDLKPSNILVTEVDGVPVPKVIDFGVAKATQARLTDLTLFTGLNQMIGTPAYMSPEQAGLGALDMDTRSDIYALGVLLYELLTGQTPLTKEEFDQAGLDEIFRLIREQDPPKPSTRLSGLTREQLTAIAARRQAEPIKLNRLLSGDLDWIVMKALEKDRRRRYETANGLMTDIQRHLKNEPVAARPPSNLYRIQKMVRRNKLAYAAGVAVTVALLIGTAVSLWQATIAIRALHETEKSRLAEKEQRLAAQQERDQATSARTEAEGQRAAAQAARQRAMAEAYAADINLAEGALTAKNLGRARQLLAQHRPLPGQPDLRNWEWRYLWQQSRGDAMATFTAQTNGFAFVDVSHDGKWLAVAGFLEAPLLLYDLSVGNGPRLVESLPRTSICLALLFSPREPILAYTESDGVDQTNTHLIHLWNFETRTNVATWRLNNVCVGLAFSADGRKLVTLTGFRSTPGQLTVWRCPDGAQLASFPIAGASALAVSPEGNVAAYGSSNNLCVIDLTTGKAHWKAKTRSNDSYYFEKIAISPNGKLLVSAEGSSESFLRFWDLATGEEQGTPIPAHEDSIDALRFLPDGHTLVSTGGDHVIRLWDVSDPRHVQANGHMLLGQESGINSVGALPDGKTLITGGNDGTVCVWDASRDHPDDAHVILPNVDKWEFALDGRSVYVLETNQVVQWHGPRFSLRTVLFDEPSGATDVSAFSTDGRLLVTFSTNGVLQLSDTQTGAPVRQFGSYPTRVDSYTFHAGRKTLLVRAGQRADLWDLDTLKVTQSWPNYVADVKFRVSDDGAWWIKWNYAGAFTRLNLAQGQSAGRQLDINQVFDAEFSPDGRRFAASSILGYVGVWDTESLKPVATVGTNRLSMWVKGFSPDGRRLLTTDWGTDELRFWDVETQRELIAFRASSDTHFSHDGNLLGWNKSGSLHIYQPPTLAEIDTAEKAGAVPESHAAWAR